MILNAKGERQLFVHPSCKLMIRGLEQQAYDQATQQPQKGDGGEDDLSGQMDLGYACWTLIKMQRRAQASVSVRPRPSRSSRLMSTVPRLMP